jgi:hypothetical protein
MKRTVIRLLLLLLVISLESFKLHAANQNPPGNLTYQGFLTDANGIPLATNKPVNYTVIFRIYDQTTGGNLLWAETQVVTVNQGYFSVLLGQGVAYTNTLPNNSDLSSVFTGPTASDRYIGLTVSGITSPDTEIAPRIRLLASPYALLARNANALVTSTGSNVLTSSINNTIGIGTAGTTTNRLTVDGGIAATTYYGTVYNGGTFIGNGAQLTGIYALHPVGGSTANSVYVAASGNVGIGNTAPNYPLATGNGAGDKFSIYDNGSACMGFGVAAQLMTIHSDAASSAIGLGSGNTGSFSEVMRIDNVNKRVGIGNTAPNYPLAMGNGAGDKISIYDNGSACMGFGVAAQLMTIHSDAAAAAIGLGSGNTGSFSEVMRIDNANKRVGIGNTTPTAPLSFANTTSEKISLYDTGIGIYGFAVAPSMLQVHSGGAGSALALGYSTASSFVEEMRLDGSGHVGIGVTAPGAMLEIKGPSNGELYLTSTTVNGSNVNHRWSIYADYDNTLKFYDMNSGSYYYITPSGSGFAGSDRRIKKDIEPLGAALDRVLKLQPVTYRLKTESETAPKSIGFIAQEVQPLFPELVNESEGKLAVGYAQMVAVAIQAIQELNQRVDAVQARETHMAELEKKAARVDALEQEMADLKKAVAQLAKDSKDTKLAAQFAPDAPRAAGGTPKTLTTASLDH